MADMKELLPCPFCGSEPYIAGAAYFSKKLIMCNVCGAEHSIEKWNTRAPSKQLTQTQQALDSAVEALEEIRIILTSCPELNSSNYGHDDVCRLNNGTMEIYRVTEAALASIKE